MQRNMESLFINLFASYQMTFAMIGAVQQKPSNRYSVISLSIQLAHSLIDYLEGVKLFD